MNTKHQLTLKVLPRYLQAIRKEKTRILDEAILCIDSHRENVVINGRFLLGDEGIKWLIE